MPPMPPIPTTPEWRQRMRDRRIAEGLTQGQLGIAVGLTQKAISEIENGEVQSSDRIAAIAKKLHIPPPFVPIGEDVELRWLEAGRSLMSADPGVFRNQLQMVEQIVSAFTRKR